jgi:acyl-coenzyme A synthetase/AMP-(fatty) acid ligase
MGVVSASERDVPYDLRSRTVGRPVEGVEYRIVEIPAAAGTQSNAGELQIRHAYGFEGYVDLNGNKLVPEKSFDGEWYRTGDLATLGPDGTLIVLGRCDLSINRNGVLLPLADVESRMRELEGVDEVAVAPGPDTIRGRALVAFCVTSRGVQVTGLQLRASYASKAPPYSVPDAVRVLDTLPKLASGKIDRLALARLAEEVVL